MYVRQKGLEAWVAVRRANENAQLINGRDDGNAVAGNTKCTRVMDEGFYGLQITTEALEQMYKYNISRWALL